MKNHQPTIDHIREMIRTKSRFVLTTHVHPDGDGIGSELALYHHLKGLGKDVHILNPSPLPEPYLFLDPQGTRIQEYEELHARAVLDADAIFLLDLSSKDRLGDMAGVVAGNRLVRIFIDHHPGQGPPGDLVWIDDGACATGELVFSLLKQEGHQIPPAVAEALYVALLTDTGCFRYANVTAGTHRVVAELLETGIDHHEIYRRVYESNSWNQSMLFAATTSGLQQAYGGKVAYMKITQEMFEQTGTQEKDTEGLAEFPRSIGEVQIAILFIEQSPRRTRVRFRSRSDIAVDGLAREIGGGGHRNAAAAVVKGEDLDGAIDKVLSLASRYLH